MGVCESCAGEDEELAPVWPASAPDSEQPELWCGDCQSRYPNEPATEDD
jgi:hypothetical protein